MSTVVLLGGDVQCRHGDGNHAVCGTECLVLDAYSSRDQPVGHVISELEAASRQSLDKSAAVSAERKRSDRILHQLMPPAIILQLKVYRPQCRLAQYLITDG